MATGRKYNRNTTIESNKAWMQISGHIFVLYSTGPLVDALTFHFVFFVFVFFSFISLIERTCVLYSFNLFMSETEQLTL